MYREFWNGRCCFTIYILYQLGFYTIKGKTPLSPLFTNKTKQHNTIEMPFLRACLHFHSRRVSLISLFHSHFYDTSLLCSLTFLSFSRVTSLLLSLLLKFFNNNFFVTYVFIGLTFLLWLSLILLNAFCFMVLSISISSYTNILKILLIQKKFF